MDTSQQLIRIGALQKINCLLQELGIDPEPELARLGMSRIMFADSDLLVSIVDVASLLEHCVKLTGRTDFHLCLAARQDMSYLGTFGLLLKTATNLGVVLDQLICFLHVHSQTTSIHLDRVGDQLVVNAAIDKANISTYQQELLVDLTLAQCYRGLIALTDNQVRIKTVMLRRKPPGNKLAYSRFFKAPVQFNAEADGLVLPKALLEMEITHADPGLHEAARQQLQRSGLSNSGNILRQEVCSIIKTLLPAKQCNIERVAQCYSCDKRTLQRRLRQVANVSYQDLLDEVRFELAEHYLGNTELAILRVANATGYFDPSNFARVFRKHYGMTPGQWRKQYRRG